MGEPHGTWSASACLPQRFDTSSHLSENAPHMQLSTFLETRLRMAPSIKPQAEEVLRKTNCFVQKSACNCGWIFAYSTLNPWPRWPIIGQQHARKVFSLSSTIT